MNQLHLETENQNVKSAFYLALSDIYANIRPGENGHPVLNAGMEYECPWVRDTAINTHNAAALLFPDIAKNSLLSCLSFENGGYRIAEEKQYGQNWDCVIWILGAWDYYIHTADQTFFQILQKVTFQSLQNFEENFRDEKMNLFRGPACYGDGVAAYPDRYAVLGHPGILSYLQVCNEKMPEMYCLSTNCLYVKAYQIAARLSDCPAQRQSYLKKSEHLKQRINDCFWMEEGRYRYLLDNQGGSDAAEGLGEAFAILFGIADDKKIREIKKNHPITRQGIACVEPSFQRYTVIGTHEYGRHSGTVWPHIQSYWADAMIRNGYPDAFDKEFLCLTANSIRDGYFSEIYHPETGLPYGGLQEEGGVIIPWDSRKKQTWSATGYLHMLINNIIGLSVHEKTFEIHPYLPSYISNITIRGLSIRNHPVSIKVSGNGSMIKRCTMNSTPSGNRFSYTNSDTFDIEIIVES